MRQLHVDWNALHSAFQMNMPEVRCFLDVEEGSVIKLPPGDQSVAEVRNQPQRYVAIEAVPSRIQYQWLDTFIKSIDDDGVRSRMEAAVNGKGAFRRFKDILLTLPDERRRWFEFRDNAMRQRIVEWIGELGIEPLNAPDWNAPAAPAPQRNRPQDIEALRDLLIAWAEDKDPKKALQPLELEALAAHIGETFRLRPLKK